MYVVSEQHLLPRHSPFTTINNAFISVFSTAALPSNSTSRRLGRARRDGGGDRLLIKPRFPVAGVIAPFQSSADVVIDLAES